MPYEKRFHGFMTRLKMVLRGPMTARYEYNGRKYAAFVVFHLLRPPTTIRFEVLDEVDQKHNPLPWKPRATRISPKQ